MRLSERSSNSVCTFVCKQDNASKKCTKLKIKGISESILNVVVAANAKVIKIDSIGRIVLSNVHTNSLFDLAIFVPEYLPTQLSKVKNIKTDTYYLGCS